MCVGILKGHMCVCMCSLEFECCVFGIVVVVRFSLCLSIIVICFQKLLAFKMMSFF